VQEAYEEVKSDEGHVPKGVSDCSFPSTLEDGVSQAIGISFKNEKYGLGFCIADKGRILEKLAESIEQAPIVMERYEDIPESVRNLPGYPVPKEYWKHEHHKVIMEWIRKLKQSLVNEVFLPNHEYLRAVKQLVQIGNGQDAVSIAVTNLDPDAIAQTCEAAQTCFNKGIAVAKQHGRPDLEERLKEAHIDAVKKGKDPKHMYWDGTWVVALELARSYGYGEDKLDSLLSEGVHTLSREFEQSLYDWRRRITQIDNIDRFTGRCGQPQIEPETERRVRLERTSNIDRPAASGLVSLIKLLPEEESEQSKKQVYETCSRYSSPWDGLGIAMALEDNKATLRFGLSILDLTRSRNGFFFTGFIDKVCKIIEERVMPSASPDQKKHFVGTLVDVVGSKSGYDLPIEVARNIGVGEWLMEQLEQKDEPYHAARIAVGLDRKDDAKRLYIKAESYGNAVEQTDDPVEKASLYLRQAGQIIRNRVQYRNEKPNDMWGIPSWNRRLNTEIEIMNNGFELVKGMHKKELSTDYLAAGSDVVKALFANGDYEEACLFVKKAELPKDSYAALLTPKLVEDAERNEDFASCYHLSRMLGRKDDAEGYKTLADEFAQQIHTRLNQLIYVEKPPKKSTAVKQDDDIDF
jgi:hypothetical protein